MSASDPFAELGIAPTLQLAAIKRAYFAELPRRPPHQDPEGFRRLRAAYEKLMTPRGLACAWAATGVDPTRDLARWREVWEPKLAEARERIECRSNSEAALAQLLALSQVTLAQARERLRGPE